MPGEWQHPKPFREGNIKTQNKSDRLAREVSSTSAKKKIILLQQSYSSCHSVTVPPTKDPVQIYAEMEHDGDMLVTTGIRIMKTSF